MKSSLNTLLTGLILAMPCATLAEDPPQWLSGVYVNQDKDARAGSLTFCPADKALYDSVTAACVVEGKDDDRVVTLYSNGAFTFRVTGQGNTLLPVDEFTKQWLSKSQLRRDQSQQYQCKGSL